MDGHNVILTGGAQNIGAGVDKKLAAAGANVMIADLQHDKAQETAEQIEAETGKRCIGMGCDVTKADDVDAAVRATGDAFGGISTLVNNVGWGRAITTRPQSPTMTWSTPMDGQKCGQSPAPPEASKSSAQHNQRQSAH